MKLSFVEWFYPIKEFDNRTRLVICQRLDGPFAKDPEKGAGHYYVSIQDYKGDDWKHRYGRTESGLNSFDEAFTRSRSRSGASSRFISSTVLSVPQRTRQEEQMGIAEWGILGTCLVAGAYFLGLYGGRKLTEAKFALDAEKWKLAGDFDKSVLAAEVRRQLNLKAEVTTVGPPYVVLKGEDVLAALSSADRDPIK